MDLSPELAVIGGSGFYRYLDAPRQIEVDTPYGSPSAPVTVGEVAGRLVAFLPRHGVDHELPPHLVNYRANIWALRKLGVRRVVGSCAVGSLRADMGPGDLAVADQLVDRTWGRADTFVEGPPVRHVSFAEPYCPAMCEGLRQAGGALRDVVVHPRATVVVVQGPRFSTRAESRWFRDAGWDLVNMTQYPEAYLARELGMCYGALALVTDHDAGLDERPSLQPVSMEAVLEVLRREIVHAQRLLANFVAASDGLGDCACSESLVT